MKNCEKLWSKVYISIECRWNFNHSKRRSKQQSTMNIGP